MSNATAVPTTNWGGNVTYTAKRVHLPESATDVARIVAGSTKAKALGTRHSFNRIADTGEDLICVAKMNRLLSIDETNKTATVEAGITYGELSAQLHARGYTITNLPSLPHVCVGGAVQTGTHGSGTANLSTEVTAIQLVTANGGIVELSRRDAGETFDGMVVMLGLLGIVTQLTLKIRPSFQIQQDVYEHVPLAELLEHFEAVANAAYSVSFFTDWQTDRVNQVWLKRDVTLRDGNAPPYPLLAEQRATIKRHPIVEIPPDFCTEQGTPGPSHERLPHFRADAPPSSAGAELQSEYFVDRAQVGNALRAIAKIGPRLKDCLMISEVRNVAQDRLWMSPAYRRPSVGIHFTWHPKEAEVLKLLETEVEPALRPFAPRPHWGKLFAIPPAEVQSRYEKLDAFRELCARFDPTGKFRNAFADRLLFQ